MCKNKKVVNLILGVVFAVIFQALEGLLILIMFKQYHSQKYSNLIFKAMRNCNIYRHFGTLDKSMGPKMQHTTFLIVIAKYTAYHLTVKIFRNCMCKPWEKREINFTICDVVPRLNLRLFTILAKSRYATGIILE